MPTFAHPPVESPLDDTIHFRQATPSDIPCLIHLVTSAYRGDDSRAGWTTEADLLDGPRIDADQIVQMLAQPRSRVIVAQRNGRIEACAHVCVEHDGGYFGMFAVEPRLQGSGLGKLVLSEAERIVQEQWQMPCMRMTVIDVRDELIAFYERRGYRRTGVYKPFPYGDARFGLPRRDNLRFEVLEKAL